MGLFFKKTLLFNSHNILWIIQTWYHSSGGSCNKIETQRGYHITSFEDQSSKITCIRLYVCYMPYLPTHMLIVDITIMIWFVNYNIQDKMKKYGSSWVSHEYSQHSFSVSRFLWCFLFLWHVLALSPLLLPSPLSLTSTSLLFLFYLTLWRLGLYCFYLIVFNCFTIILL